MRRLATVVVAAVIVAAACSDETLEVPLGPDGRPDAVLETGRILYGQKCSSCHGGRGQGGRGKKLNEGRILEAHPDIETMNEVIADGMGNGMPAFGDQLDDAEIEAVSRYIREVLN